MKKQIVNENGEIVIRMNAPDLQPLTDKQINMIEAASKKEYVYDEDCPPLDDELLLMFDHDIAEMKKTTSLPVSG